MIGLQDLPFDFSGLGVRAATKLWMLQRKYLWQLFLPSTIGGVLGYSVSQFCQEVTFGSYALSDVVKMQQGAFTRFYAGLQDIKAVSLLFLLPSDNTVLDYFYGWYHLMIDELGYYHPKMNYGKQFFISMYDRSGIETVKFIMKGAFPTAKPTMGLSFDSNGIQSVTIPLSVDNVEMWSLGGSARRSISKLLGGDGLGALVGTVAENAGLYGVGGVASTAINKIL